ncbi:MAG: alpha/beta fold hydrolase [Moraxella sp.]|nr:alpha/beta fold hydrolase [Moraxella sp.]
MRPLFIITITFGCLLAGCQSLRPMTAASTIESERANITTSTNLSHATNSVVIASGYTQIGCFDVFDDCLAQVKQNFLDNAPKHQLATLAELYYAYARHLHAKQECQPFLVRPPIDAYYANAPISAEAQAHKDTAMSACLSAYQQALYASLRHSFAYLFFESLNDQPTSGSTFIDEQSIKTQDIYHVASATLIDEVYASHKGSFANANSILSTQHNIANSTQSHVLVNQIHTNDGAGTTDTLYFYLVNDPYYLDYLGADAHTALSQLDSIYHLPKLDTISTRSGFGVGYVGSLNNRPAFTLKQAIKAQKNSLDDLPTQTNDTLGRTHPMQHLLLTALVIPKGNTLDEVLSSHHFDVYFFNPYHTDSISLFNQSHPLYGNFSAGYAKWINENQFRQLGIVNMLDKNYAKLPELFMLEPYNPNKKVIILLHGLASSPKTWVEVTNSLLSDPLLRNNYQVWQVFYATNLPILENRYQIHKLINDNFARLDPEGKAFASHDNVLIGHSMGGIISRLLLSEDTLLARLEELDNTITPKDVLEDSTLALNNLQTNQLLSDLYNQELKERFVLTPLPQISTAVFISTPHRGTDYADRWFTRALRRMIALPVNITQDITNTLTQNNTQTARTNALGALYLDNGASQLSDKSAFMALTQHTHLTPKVTYHSIMGNNTGKDANVSSATSDGIVPYDSSHLEGAASEVILTGGHSIHENPQTILHLRKILHEHLATHQAIAPLNTDAPSE